VKETFEFLERTYDSGLLLLVTAAVLLALAWLLLPRAGRGRTRIAAVYLALAFAASAFEPVVPKGTALARVVSFFFFLFALASCGRSLVLLAVDVVFGRSMARAAPGIFRDLAQAVTYVIVLLITLRAVGVEPGSLLTTSALLTAVIGLALQDTLGNLVSGLALQMRPPFEVGDWIQFGDDARQAGRVTELNWRATTLVTSDHDEVTVPNSTLTKASIRNFSRPSPVARRVVTVQGPYEASPERVKAALVRAAQEVPGVVVAPAPWVQTRSFADSGIEYAVWFFIEDFEERERIDGNVRDRVWYALQRAKLSVPFPIRNVFMHEVSDATRARAEELELSRRDDVLRCVEFLNVLPDANHKFLAASAELRVFAPGEVVVRQGDTSAEMFIIDEGLVTVELDHGERSSSVARLGPGTFFGEMGLMTGVKRNATVRAIGECRLLVIRHDAFEKTIASVPEVIERMSELLAARQAELEAVASERRPTLEPIEDRSKQLFRQIRSFFKLR
jgi:small-conductance mechanosensitive channel